MSVDSDHEHELDAEYLYPSDAQILEIYEEGGALRIRIAIPCPDCDETLALDAAVENVEEVDMEVPLGGPEEPYD